MAPRRTRGPRPQPTWGGRRRKETPRCSSGGSPSRATAVAGAAVAPSSWQPHREPSFELPVGHASSVVVAKVAVGHSSASSSSGYFSPRDEVSTSSLQPPCMSSLSGCTPPQQPGLTTCVAGADGADAVVSASSGNPSAALSSSLLEEEEPLSPGLQMEVAVPEEEEEEEALARKLQMEVALQNVVARFMVFYFDAYEKRTLSTDYVESLSPALRLEVAIEFLFRLDLASKKRVLSADELDLIIDVKSQLPCLEEEVGEVNDHVADVVDDEEEVEEEEKEQEEFIPPSRLMEAALKIMFRLDLARERRILSVDELDLYDDMRSLLPHFEAEIAESNADGADPVEEEAKEDDNADGVDAVEEEEAKEEDNADGADALEEDEEELSPELKKEVAIEVLFQLDLQRKKRILSAGELDLIIFLKSQLVRLDAEIGEVNDDDDDDEEEEEPLSPALEMQAALKVMFRLDLARETRILSADELDLYDEMKSLLTCLEAEAEVGKDTADGVDAVEEEGEAKEEDNADGADVVVEKVEAKEEDNADGADVVEEDEEEPLSPELKKEIAIEVLFQLDLQRKKRTLSAGELDLIIFLKSQLARLDAEIAKVNDDDDDDDEEEEEEEEGEEEPLSPALEMQAALKVMFRLDLARETRILSADELDLYDEMKSLLTCLEAEVGEDTAFGVDAVEEEEVVVVVEEEDPLLHKLQMEFALQMVVAKFMVFYFDAHKKRTLSTDYVKSLSPALKLEVAIEHLFRLDLASKKRTLSADELDLIIHLKSQLPCLEEEIGEINAHGADAAAEEEEEEEEFIPPLRLMEAALKIIFRLDLARERRILSVDELDLYDDMKSLLPRLEAEIGEDNADGADAVEEEDNAAGAHAVEVEEEEEEEEEPLWPALKKEVALHMVLAKFILFYLDAHEKMFSTDELKSLSPELKMEVAIEVLFQLDLQRKKRILSANELDLIIHLKSQLPHLEAAIGEINAHEADAVEEEEEVEDEEEERLSPSLIMQAALKIMFRLDLAREMRILSVDELDLYDDMKSLLPSLEAEIEEVTTAASIASEDPPTCQLHVPSVALAGAKEVQSPMVLGASTSMNLSADLQLAERSIVATKAELSTPGPEATPSVLKSSAEPEPAVEDDEFTKALYGHSVRRPRLPIFRGICPE